MFVRMLVWRVFPFCKSIVDVVVDAVLLFNVATTDMLFRRLYNTHHYHFRLVFNFIVPWGNFQTYLIRPDADNGPFSTHHADRPSEKAWKSFLEGDTEYRNTVLKFIPRIIAGPWMVKKMVGSTPAIIGQKLPVSYSGSIEENYLEVSLDVTQGPALGNTIANTVAGKADVVTVDLGFVLEGQDADGTLPEQMLGLVRLHHFNMKEAITHAKWKEELRLRSQS